MHYSTSIIMNHTAVTNSQQY